jgi:integrase
MAKSRLRLVTPTTVNRTVTPNRPPNKDLRTREHLTEAEVERLIKAAQDNRYGHRDGTMILVAYRHGLRAAELVDLRWEQIDFRTATLHVRRVKQGNTQHASDSRRGIARPPPASTRTGAEVAFRVYVRARCSIYDCRLRPHDRASWKGREGVIQGTSSYAQARLWIRACQSGPRHEGAAGLPRSQGHPAHGALHRAVADAV